MKLSKRVAGFGVALVVFAALGLYWSRSGGAPAPKGGDGEGVPVKVARARVADATNEVSSVGTVQAFNTVLVRARVDGEISRVVFREGQDVRRGDVLVELDRRPLEAQWRAAIAQQQKDQAQLENARVDLARYELLAKTDSGPRQTLDTTRALVLQLEAAVSADAAQVEAARLQVEYATIRAPIDGRAGARLVDAGNMVRAGDANGLVVLTQVHPVFLSFALPQGLLPVLRAEQAKGALRVIALSQDATQVLGEGKLSLIDNQVDAATGTIRCKATFPNPNETLWPGQFATARAVLGSIRNAVLVPSAAVQAGTDGSYVYVVDSAIAKVRRVTTGPMVGGDVVVASGLSAGETVVVEGQFQLEPGARVTVK